MIVRPQTNKDLRAEHVDTELDYKEEYEAVSAGGRIVATFDTLDGMKNWAERSVRVSSIRYRRKTIITEEIKI